MSFAGTFVTFPRTEGASLGASRDVPSYAAQGESLDRWVTDISPPFIGCLLDAYCMPSSGDTAVGKKTHLQSLWCAGQYF